jgi:hypothetical protein
MNIEEEGERAQIKEPASKQTSDETKTTRRGRYVYIFPKVGWSDMMGMR